MVSVVLYSYLWTPVCIAIAASVRTGVICPDIEKPQIPPMFA